MGQCQCSTVLILGLNQWVKWRWFGGFDDRVNAVLGGSTDWVKCRWFGGFDDRVKCCCWSVSVWGAFVAG